MKHNAKKKILLGGTLLGLCFGLAYGTPKNETGSVLNATRCYYAENQTSVETENETEPETSLAEEEKGNLEKIEQLVSEYLERENVDQTVYDILKAITSAVGVLASLLYMLFYWRRKANKFGEVANEANTISLANSRTIANANKQIESLNKDTSAVIDKVDSKIEELNKRVDSLLKEVEVLTNANKELSKTNTSLSKDYSSVSSRLDAVLVNQALLANTQENTTNGTNKKVQENVNGAISYGKEKESKPEEE